MLWTLFAYMWTVIERQQRTKGEIEETKDGPLRGDKVCRVGLGREAIVGDQTSKSGHS